MDKKKKIIIVLGVIGLVLMCGGIFLGGNPYSIPAMFSETNPPEGIQNPEEVKKSAVHSIKLNLINSHISIKPGDHFSLTGTGTFNSYVKDGVFYAGADDTKHSADLFGMKVRVPSKWVCGYGSYILTLPSKSSLDNITINTFHCDIAADTLQASNLNINMTAGDLTINHASADTLSIDVKGGKTIITNPVITNAGNIQASGDITIGDPDASEVSLNNMSLDSSRGDLSVIGQVTGTTQLQTGFGDITVTLPGSSENYGLTAQEGELAISPATVSEASSEHFGDIVFASKHRSSSVHFK